MMKDICLFLSGKQEEIVKKLEKRMSEASDALDFEKAMSIRDKIAGIKHIAEKQKVMSATDGDQDVIASAGDRTDSCVQVFFVRGGKLIGREHFIFEGEGATDPGELIGSFIEQFYADAAFIPHEILLQKEIDSADAVEKWLSEKNGSRVVIKTPRRGEKLKLVEMVAQNAAISLRQFQDRIGKDGLASGEGLEGMTALLGIDRKPRRIEAYDVSNTGTSETVASMVVFEDGKPSGSEYRKFRIKSQDRQNDYASMQEAVTRRFKHAQKEKDGGHSGERKFSKLPDIILVDGGLGHVNAVSGALGEMGISIPVFGMVKDERHRTRGLVSPDREVDLSDNLPVLRFVTAVQDEAHRFAVKYNKQLREKRYNTSVLDGIEGVGPGRKKALIRHFRSIDAIRSAGIDDLAAVKGMNMSAARKVYEFFRR